MRFGWPEIPLLLFVIFIIAARIYIPVQIIKREKRVREERIKVMSAVFKKQSADGLTDTQRRVRTSVLSKIPATAKIETMAMRPDKQALFVEKYLRKSKDIFDTYLHWVIGGMHYSYLEENRKQWYYWLTLGGLLIWAVVDIFRIPAMVAQYNRNLAAGILREMKISTE